MAAAGQRRCLCHPTIRKPAISARMLGTTGLSGWNPAWRNCYLNGADELATESNRPAGENSGDLARCMDSRMMLDYLGILIDGEQAEDKDIKLNLAITDTQEKFCVHLIPRRSVSLSGASRKTPGRH